MPTTSPGPRFTFPDFARYKAEHRRITMVTAYDYPTARLADAAGLDVLLVGDSLANVVLGLPRTLPVTMEEMLYHTRAVTRGNQGGLVVADMPFLSYQVSVEDAVRNAGRFLKEAGADGVKLEGGAEVAPAVAAMVCAGIPVVGHVGLTPQSVAKFGGYKVQGRGAEDARRLLIGAQALERAGASAVVLECVPDRVAERLTRELGVATIGIGAGAACDGQVLVFHDLVGLSEGKSPRFVKRYADLHGVALEALGRYAEEVRGGRFPAEGNAYTIDEEEFRRI
ncbi:MAG: 3-methyl-2-oxobutanoate hydroxymethyltransferase [Planctomycetes bacterium]|nr:3-methyl-2-oxobutanoate hydroxymethyltransferase [Planctomycetota bacterium]